MCARFRDLKSDNNPHATKRLADALIAVNRETYETPDKKRVNEQGRGSARLCYPDMAMSGAMKLVELSPRENYGLFLRYEDGIEGVVDLSSLAGRGVFALWLKPGVFEQAKLSDAGVPEWPGELDLCSDSLYMQLTGKSAEEIFPNLRRIPAHA